MIVLITHKLPPSIRGRLKLWCVEPKPNVFISNVNGRIATLIINMITSVSSKNTGGIIIQSDKSINGFSITEFGCTDGKLFVLDGICVFRENHKKQD